MRTLVALLLFFNLSTTIAQIPENSKSWQKEYIEDKLTSLDINDFTKYDFSDIISNQNRFTGDGWSTYTGVFGPKNRRIDFHLLATKTGPREYIVNGKSKLGNNVRELTGKVELINAYKTNWRAQVITFKYELNEPGNKDGDGKFVGIGAIAFEVKENKPDIFWSEAGDYREYNNIFVGEWLRFGSTVSRECIFSFYVSGTHNKLPLRSELYKPFPEESECKCFFELKDDIRQYGWQDYDDRDIKKEMWWK
jgi:hypothetical protein